jgi:hypothetical protein
VNQIRTIELSLRCFVFSVLGLIPLVGLPMSVLALACYRQQLREGGQAWNPAGVYLAWGVILGVWGSLMSSLVCGLILMALLR